MNTSYQKLEDLIIKFPSEKDTLERLKVFIAKEVSSEGKSEKIFPLNRLFDKLLPHSDYSLLEIMTYLVDQGAVERIFRVESPKTHTGIADFESPEDIPDTIHDETTDEEIEVSVEDVKMYFKFKLHEDLG